MHLPVRLSSFGKAILLFVCMSIGFHSCQNIPAYQNPDLTTEKRVEDLVSRLTLEEKIPQLRYDAPAVERLGIPAYNWWNECLHGVARSGRATVFPQAIGLAAIWDENLIHEVSTAISDEARAKYHDFMRREKHGIYQGLTFWTPNINIFRDPRWGRGMETYGEDPFLTGRIGIQFIKGLQGNDPKYLKTVATVKHFAVHSGPEPDRHKFDAHVSDRDLFETYLPHFRACIIDGKAQSLMCAYNLYMGDPCCGNTFLLEDVLRKNWGFTGYVVSDCWALTDFYNFQPTAKNSAEAGAIALKAGTDLNCGVVYRDLQHAVDSGFVDEEKINRSLKRLLKARFQLGMFDPPELVPYSQIPIEVNDSKKHRELALQTARESIVLLKNEGHVLPIKKNLKSIAVIGPNANDVEVLLGNYNGTPTEPVTPLQGIAEKVLTETRVIYAQGCDWAGGMPKLLPVSGDYLSYEADGKTNPGLMGEYYDNYDMNGIPVQQKPAPVIDFNFWDKAPLAGLDDDNYSVKWTGYLLAPETGSYLIGAYGNGYSIFLQDSLLVSYGNRHESHLSYVAVQLIKGERYPIRVDAINKMGDCEVELRWLMPGINLEEEAIIAAKQADLVVLCLGLSPRLEGEEMKVPVKGFSGGDRLTLDLPEVQQDLMKKIFSVNKNIVLILLNGSALSINWADENIPAIVEAWYPGQAGGTAIADVLFGDYNPAGRLPVTFYKSVDDIPPFDDYDMEGRTYRYFKGEPLYPFGHGLSFTTFEYSQLEIPDKVESGNEIPVAVTVRNSGNIAGEEVIQIYVSDLHASVTVPIRSLAGFERIFLEPGKEKTINFIIDP
nr:glycoside hydrolase family 3 C-terminal domain-containing protein [Bacteroidota bacterium]